MALGRVHKVLALEWRFVSSQAQHTAARKTTRQTEATAFDPAEDFPLLTAEATRLRIVATDTVQAIFRLADHITARAHQRGVDNPIQRSPSPPRRFPKGGAATGRRR